MLGNDDLDCFAGDSGSDDMFGGSDSDGSQQFDDPPAYVKNEEFEQFVHDRNIVFDERYGFMQVNTFKDYYFPGQIVRGYAVLTAFNELKEKALHLKVHGVEIPGTYTNDIEKVLTTDKNLAGQGQGASQMNLTRGVTRTQLTKIFSQQNQIAPSKSRKNTFSD